jgi:hypothetical protein
MWSNFDAEEKAQAIKKMCSRFQETATRRRRKKTALKIKATLQTISPKTLFNINQFVVVNFSIST